MRQLITGYPSAKILQCGLLVIYGVISFFGIDLWWRHQMETFSAVLAICAGNSPVLGEFPTQRPVTRSFDVFFDLRLNKRLSKQSWGWWLETLSRPLWRHRNVHVMVCCLMAVRLHLNQCWHAVSEPIWRNFNIIRISRQRFFLQNNFYKNLAIYRWAMGW